MIESLFGYLHFKSNSGLDKKINDVFDAYLSEEELPESCLSFAAAGEQGYNKFLADE